MRIVPVLAGGMLGTLVVLGCDAREATTPSAKPLAAEVVVVESNDVAAAIRKWNALDNMPSTMSANPEFHPPFAGRQTIFTPPDLGDAPLVTRPVAAPGPSAAVELKGFVVVGEPRAVLVIGDEVAPLARGQERHGVKVLAIEPPQVTIEQGGNRWSLSLGKISAE